MQAPQNIPIPPLLAVPRDIRGIMYGMLDGRSLMALSRTCHFLNNEIKLPCFTKVWKDIFLKESRERSFLSTPDWRKKVIFMQHVVSSIQTKTYISLSMELFDQLKCSSHHTQVFCQGQLFISDGSKIFMFNGKEKRSGQIRFVQDFPPNVRVESIDANHFAITGDHYLNFFGGKVNDPIRWNEGLAWDGTRVAYNTDSNENFIYDLKTDQRTKLVGLSNTDCFFGLHQDILFGRLQSGNIFIYTCTTNELEQVAFPFPEIHYQFSFPLFCFASSLDKPVQAWAVKNR